MTLFTPEQPVHPPPSAAEIETLCGRTGTFATTMEALLGLHTSTPLARGVHACDDPGHTRTWWFWPWKLDATDERGPWWRCHADDIRAHAQRSPHRFNLLSIAVPSEPEHPDVFVAMLEPWLREVFERPQLEVELLGPSELLRDHPPRPSASWKLLEIDRALAARPIEYSKLEQRVVALLDADPESDEAWSILADHLQGSGSESGELLALDSRLATIFDPNERAELNDHLARRWHDHGDYPLRTAGPSGFSIQGRQGSSRVWTAWRGPFISRLLVSGPNDLCMQLCSRPEARYLSCRRVARIGSEGTDLSSCDLSGWNLRDVSCISHSFVESNLRGCEFAETKFQKCSFDGADLRGASFRQAPLIEQCRFVEARVGPDTADLLTRVAVEAVLDRLSIEEHESAGIQR